MSYPARAEGVVNRIPWCSSYRKGSLRVTLDYGSLVAFNSSTDLLFLQSFILASEDHSTVTLMFHSSFFLVFWQSLSLLIFFHFHCLTHLNSNIYVMTVFFWGGEGVLLNFSRSTCLLEHVVYPGLGDQFVSQNFREFYASHSIGLFLVCAYTIWKHDQILFSCTIPNESPFSSNHIYRPLCSGRI